MGGGDQTPPFLGHDVGFLTLGPKLDPPPFLLVDLRWTPVADPGCVCVTGVITPPPPPWNVDDVTWATSKGGACECPRVGLGVFFNFSEGR